MKLYQERKVNPFGSCLPLLVQMPIFIAMFYVIQSFGDAHPTFTSGGILWFQNLSVHDPYYILPILSAVTMLAASEITAKSMDPQQRWLMRLLPVVFTVFLLRFPAGLFMYWITSNLVSLVQNYLIYNHGPGRRTTTEKQTAPLKSDSASRSPAVSQSGAEKPQQKAREAGSRRRRRKKKK